jgi:hypothetical protein
MMRCFILFLSLALFATSPSFAELPHQVELDFAVLSGTVIMPVDGEYLIDLDDRDNLHEGDILTLVAPGKKIFHPQTKELIGTVDKPIGFLQVTRIKSGYSYAKPLSAGLKPDNGAQVKRFEQVPALFVDNNADEGALASQVMMDLPQFLWLPEEQGDQALVTFILQGNELDVKTVQGSFLHNYEITENQQVKTPSEPVRRPFVPSQGQSEPKLLDKLAQGALSLVNLNDEDYRPGRDITMIRQGAGRQQGVWLGPNIEGHPVGIAVADLDGDGQQETVVALSNKLMITRISEGKQNDVAEVAIPSLLQLLSLDVADLDANGRPELYVTAISGFQPSSLVIEFTGDGYEIVIREVRWLLRVVEFPGNDPALIGQAMVNDKQIFSGSPFYVRREGDRLERGGKLKLPGLLNLYSFVQFTDAKGQRLYAHLTTDDHLKVVTLDGVDLWESEEYYGGSETCFDNRQEHRGDMVVPTCIPPRLYRTDDNNVLVVQNDGQRMMQRYRKFKQSRLVSMFWNGFALTESWRTANQQGYLSDYALADADNDGVPELAMAVKFQHKGVIDKPRSSIVMFDMQ